MISGDYEAEKIHALSDDEVFVKSLLKPELFSEIVDRYQQPFLRKAKDILKNEDDAYDAVQEAFVRIYSAARKYRKQEGASFKSWGYRILMNQCFTMYQKKKRERLRTADIDEDFMDAIPDKQEMSEYDQKLSKEYVMSLVSRLPVKLARVITMYFLEDMPQQEVAKIEGVSYEVVRARIHKAKKELRKINEINSRSEIINL